MDDQDDFEALLKAREEGDVNGDTKEEGSRNSFTDKKDEDEEDDDEVNVDEDEHGKGLVNGTALPKISVKISQLNKKQAEYHAPTVDSYDWTLLDELFGMLDTQEAGEDIEPILAGYFNKIV